MGVNGALELLIGLFLRYGKAHERFANLFLGTLSRHTTLALLQVRRFKEGTDLPTMRAGIRLCLVWLILRIIWHLLHQENNGAVYLVPLFCMDALLFGGRPLIQQGNKGWRMTQVSKGVRFGTELGRLRDAMGLTH